MCVYFHNAEFYVLMVIHTFCLQNITKQYLILFMTVCQKFGETTRENKQCEN